MKAIILAAGKGTRLLPHTLHKPKCLVELEGRSLLDRQIDILNSRNIDEIYVVGGYLSNLLVGERYHLIINQNYETTNMVTSLFCAEYLLKGDVLISYGDIVYSGTVLDRLLSSDNEIAITIDDNWESYWRSRHENPLDDAESLELNNYGDVISIGQKVTDINLIEGQYMGLMIFNNDGTRILKNVYHNALNCGQLGPKNIEESYMTDLLQEVISKGGRIKGIRINSDWIEIDSSKDLTSEVTINRIRRIAAELSNQFDNV